MRHRYENYFQRLIVPGMLLQFHRKYGKQLEQHYQIIDQEYLTRFKEKNKGIRRETVPQMLRRRAKAELIARGLPPKLEGDWKAILKEPSQVLETIPEGIEQQASV